MSTGSGEKSTPQSRPRSCRARAAKVPDRSAMGDRSPIVYRNTAAGQRLAGSGSLAESEGEAAHGAEWFPVVADLVDAGVAVLAGLVVERVRGPIGGDEQGVLAVVAGEGARFDGQRPQVGEVRAADGLLAAGGAGQRYGGGRVVGSEASQRGGQRGNRYGGGQGDAVGSARSGCPGCTHRLLSAAVAARAARMRAR